MKNNEIINVRLSDDDNSVMILDQTLLPNETKYVELQNVDELHEAIYSLRVRGAPAIGIFAAYSLYVLAKQIKTEDFDEFFKSVMKYSEYLDTARPTAVNLSTQLRRMEDVVKNNNNLKISQILEAMREEAINIYNEDVEMCRVISEYGVKLLRDANASNGCKGILTQCNAGPIATSKYGTALVPILLGHEMGMKLRAYVCETRPLLQGARLTAYELDIAGVDTTLICDNMASVVMNEGKIHAVFAGCDRIASNGDVANKIGTNGLAILAKHYNIPFYVFGPTTTIDMNCATGADIEIELREPREIREMFYSKPMAPLDIKCYNPAFDVTPNSLITAIITEKGIHREGLKLV